MLLTPTLETRNLGVRHCKAQHQAIRAFPATKTQTTCSELYRKSVVKGEIEHVSPKFRINIKLFSFFLISDSEAEELPGTSYVAPMFRQNWKPSGCRS